MCSNTSNYDSEEEFEMCTFSKTSLPLAFDPSALENIILKLCDRFNFRLILKSRRAQGAMLVTTGLAVAGGLVGNHYGGKLGAAVGGAVGGACGLGIVAVSMRDVWEDIKSKLAELYDVVYDYLAGLGIQDYQRAAIFLAQGSPEAAQMAMLVATMAAKLLGTKVLSSLTQA